MEFFRRAAASPSRLGVFPGTFNPPTVAHLALARAALAEVGEVLFVLPRSFPHKPYRDTTLEQRLELLAAALEGASLFSMAVADGGLFIEIARECRKIYPPPVRLSFVCGRDAAERVAGWDYGRRGAWQEMLQEFDLLVAPRAGESRPEAGDGLALAGTLAVDPGWATVSASEVRRRIAAGDAWEHLVPAEIRAAVRRLYGSL